MTRTALDILNTVYGYPAFRGHQAEVVDHLTAGGDALLLMPTGGGKSVCYQIPALLREGTGIVVSPLIALMQDQVDALRLIGLRAAFLNSTLSLDDVRLTEELLRRGELDLLYVAPERLLQERTLALLDETREGSGLALFAIDEAHCVSQWGHDFRPEYLQLDILASRYPGVPRLACTATADERTRVEILENLKLGTGRVFVGGFDRPNIRYSVVPKDNPRRQLLDFLRDEHDRDAGIVYCLSRKRTEETAAFLSQNGIEALPYHAGMTADARRRHQERFLREDGLVICATIAFGMGIDKPDVRFVAHVDLPKSVEGYYQETGRAGRDGLPADAWLCYGLQDVVMLNKIAENSGSDDQPVDEMHRRRQRQQLDAMLGYCEIVDCRRQMLLAYFGEDLPEPCGNCDTCLAPPETYDGTVAAQKVLSCVARTGQRFGAQHIIDVLRGSENERIRRFGHDQLPTHGVGQEFDAFAWRSVLRQLVAQGILALDPEGFGGLKLTAASRPVLQGERELRLRRDVLTKTASRRRAASPAALTADFDGEVDAVTAALFDRLRAVRKDLAAEQGVPPYVIFHDKTLAAMALHKPTSGEAFLRLSGVGEKKLERYGERFMDVVRSAETEAG